MKLVEELWRALGGREDRSVFKIMSEKSRKMDVHYDDQSNDIISLA